MAGLQWLCQQANKDDWVLVHDAARPCLPLEALTSLIGRARELGEGVILAEPVADTLKKVAVDGQVTSTVDRQALWRAQTPQLFPLFALHAALSRCLDDGMSVTDEAMAMERAGESVHVLKGPSSNIKVTVEADLAFAELVLRKRGRRNDMMRIGHGYDVHAFGEGDFVMLGGVRIPLRCRVGGALRRGCRAPCAVRCLLGAAGSG